MRFFATVGLLALLVIGSGPLALAEDPIAHYPLVSDALDATGNHGPMILQNAPFQDGGVYLNGVYAYAAGGSNAQTPSLGDLDFSLFTISAEFKLASFPCGTLRTPVFVGGDGWRWLGLEISQAGEVKLLYNNSNVVSSGTFVQLDTWYQGRISYSASSSTCNLYLDGALIVSQSLVLDHGNNANITTNNFSNGTNFHGIFRELYVFNTDEVPSPVVDATWGAVKALYR